MAGENARRRQPRGLTLANDRSIPLSPTYQVGDERQLLTQAYLGATVAKAEDFTALAKYTSSDETVATVSPTGLVTALKPGTTRITATYAWVAPDDQTKGSVESFMDVKVEKGGWFAA